MENKNRPLKTDVAFLSLLVLSFAGILFFAFDANNLVGNGIMLCGSTVVFLISYFTKIKSGLISAVAVLFLLAIYTIINCTVKGVEIPVYVFFWFLWLPLMTLALSLFLQCVTQLRSENSVLMKRIKSNEMKDETTKLKNQRFFQNDALRAMQLSNRCKIPLSLIVWKLNQEDIIVKGKEQDINIIVVHISDILAELIGDGDECYILSQSPYLWGSLIFRSPEDTEKKAEDIQQKMLSEVSQHRSLRDFNILNLLDYGIHDYKGEAFSAFAFLQKAKEAVASNKSEVIPEVEIQEQSTTDSKGNGAAVN